jgi:hypothetical protein
MSWKPLVLLVLVAGCWWYRRGKRIEAEQKWAKFLQDLQEADKEMEHKFTQQRIQQQILEEKTGKLQKQLSKILQELHDFPVTDIVQFLREAIKQHGDCPGLVFHLKWCFPEIFDDSLPILQRKEKARKMAEIYRTSPELWRRWWDHESENVQLKEFVSTMLSDSIQTNLIRIMQLSGENYQESKNASKILSLPEASPGTKIRAMLLLDTIFCEPNVPVQITQMKLERFIDMQEANPLLFTLDTSEICIIL